MAYGIEELRGAIRDVVYEYSNLISAAYWDMCPSRWRGHADDAFLLGCRKLGDFLMQDEREKDNVLATDYLPEGKDRTWSLPIWDGQWRAPMNKQLAHIALDRSKVWDHQKWVPLLEKEFRDAWRKFRKAIVDEEFKREFERQLTERESAFEGPVLKRFRASR